MSGNVVSLSGEPPIALTQGQIEAVDCLREAIRQIEAGQIADVFLVKQKTDLHPDGEGWGCAWATTTATTIEIIGALEALKLDVFQHYTEEA